MLSKSIDTKNALPVELEGWNFQGLLYYARGVNPENFSPLAKAKGTLRSLDIISVVFVYQTYRNSRNNELLNVTAKMNALTVR